MGRIKIEQKKCKACYLCVEVCPKKLLTKSSKSNEMGAFPVEFHDTNNECLGCAMCAVRCPHLAITEVLKSE